jgi:metallo-beta-lactamase class B
MREVGYRLPARKPGELNPLVDPEGFLEQLASMRSGAERRLEIERKAGR